MTRALPLLLLALSLPAAATDSESFARRYLAYVHAVGQHSERLWPGWRMADKAFLYSDGRNTWVADAEGRAQRTTAAGDSDPDLDLSYAFPRYRGRPAVLLQISAAHLRSNTGNSETLAAIGPHEAFHRYAQEDWPGLRKPGGYRGDLATLDPRPREYRYALFQSLLQALRTPGQRDSYLSDAQGWLRRWREAAPEESRLAAQVDLSEGTARYIEMAAAARYRSDFAEDPQRYRQALREYALAFYDANEIGVGVDSEAYEIGALAGVLLDLRDDDADWKEAAMAGTWPLDYLLRDQPPAWSELPDDARALPARDGRHPPAPGRVAGGLRRPTATAAGDPATAPHHRLRHGGQQGARGLLRSCRRAVPPGLPRRALECRRADPGRRRLPGGRRRGVLPGLRPFGADSVARRRLARGHAGAGRTRPARPPGDCSQPRRRADPLLRGGECSLRTDNGATMPARRRNPAEGSP
ncbi:TPA: hypothetical protein L4844_001794 [Pseudomonas aeruginosa]|nr:hypothetical protein [Pseudomonas aeruginosa]HBO6769691.1 hypothetical protein [Pseudomonas aeruginosa]